MKNEGDKTGKSYEVLTQAIFQLILDQEEEGVSNVRVKHNVKLKGKTATHQIDVYWKFERAGQTYETIVQAKGLSSPVEQGELFKFHCVIADLPGQPKGIFVTRSGYQSGAEKYAKRN
jgi:hypothetical protein